MCHLLSTRLIWHAADVASKNYWYHGGKIQPSSAVTNHDGHNNHRRRHGQMDPTKQEEPILNIIQIVEKNPLLNIQIEDYNSLNKFIKIATIVLRFLIKRIPKLATRLPEAINQPRTLILQWYLQWEQKEH